MIISLCPSWVFSNEPPVLECLLTVNHLRPSGGEAQLQVALQANCHVYWHTSSSELLLCILEMFVKKIKSSYTFLHLLFYTSRSVDEWEEGRWFDPLLFLICFLFLLFVHETHRIHSGAGTRRRRQSFTFVIIQQNKFIRRFILSHCSWSNLTGADMGGTQKGPTSDPGNKGAPTPPPPCFSYSSALCKQEVNKENHEASQRFEPAASQELKLNCSCFSLVLTEEQNKRSHPGEKADRPGGSSETSLANSSMTPFNRINAPPVWFEFSNLNFIYRLKLIFSCLDPERVECEKSLQKKKLYMLKYNNIYRGCTARGENQSRHGRTCRVRPERPFVCSWNRTRTCNKVCWKSQPVYPFALNLFVCFKDRKWNLAELEPHRKALAEALEELQLVGSEVGGRCSSSRPARRIKPFEKRL